MALLSKIFGGASLFALVGLCCANTVTYDWVNQSGPVDSGSMVFTLNSGTPGQFTGATLSAFNFTFQNGTTVTLGSDGVAVTAVSGTGWSAGTNGASSIGFLTSVAEISNAPHAVPIFTFQFQPYAGQSTGVDEAAMGTQQSFGVWKESVSTVPLPASMPMLLFGLVGLGAFAWQRSQQHPR